MFKDILTLILVGCLTQITDPFVKLHGPLGVSRPHIVIHGSGASKDIILDLVILIYVLGKDLVYHHFIIVYTTNQVEFYCKHTAFTTCLFLF